MRTTKEKLLSKAFPYNCNRTTKYNYVIAVKMLTEEKHSLYVHNVYFLYGGKIVMVEHSVC